METESSRHWKSGVHPGRLDMLYCLLLTALCIFIFRKTLLEGSLLFGSDFVGFYQGLKQFLLDELRNRHDIPFWNPYVFGGMPFWAHLESTIFYPLDFLFWFMAPEKAFGYTMFIHMLLAALFMYAFLGSFRVTRAGRCVGAVVFTCNGFIMATLYDGQMFRVQAYMWLPLAIWVVNRAFKPEHSYLNAVMAGLFWGFQILSGSPQDALYTLMAVFLFCLFADSQKGGRTKAFGKKALVLIIFMAFGLGTAAIQIIPAVEFIRLSVRSAFDAYDLVTLGSYPFEGIITALIPDFFGKYTTGDFWVSNVPWSIPLYNLYVGILPLILLAFIPLEERKDRKIVLFAGTLGMGAIVLALGANTPIYKLIYLLPGFDRIRAPAKIIYLYVFALSLLSGIGMDGFLRLTGKSLVRRSRFVFFLALFLVALDGIFHWDKSLIFKFLAPFILDETIPGKTAHAADIIGSEFHVLTLLCISMLLIVLLAAKGVVQRRTAASLLCMLLVFDLLYMNRGAIRYGDEGYEWAERTKQSVTRSFESDKSTFRVGSSPNSMGPNFEMYLGLQTVAGYNPLYLYRYYEYIRKYNPSLLKPGKVSFSYRPDGQRVLMDLLNVKYEISHKNGTVARRESYLPRVFFVPGYEILDRSNILDRLVQSDFDPKEKILFEVADSPPLDRGRKPTADAPVQKASAEILSYGPDEILAAVQAPTAGFIFFSEIYYPGWRAYVDERPAVLLRGNYIFRVVPIPQGDHLVKLVFDSPTIRAGLAISALTLFMIVLLSVLHFARKSSFRRKMTP